jgi:hypothetical protein
MTHKQYILSLTALALVLALAITIVMAYRIGRGEHRVCAITRTVEDVGWRDQYGKSHDSLPMCRGRE